MTLQEFRDVIRAYVPGAKTAVVSDTLLDLIINAGVYDVNLYALAYKGDEKFNVVAEQQTYQFSVEITDFVCFDKGGLWWNRGSASSPDWVRLDGFTRESINSQYPRWLSDTSDNPLRYIVENDLLYVHPKGNTSLSNGFWAFYVKKPTNMTAAGHYPFTGSTTQITALSVLDDAIVDYVRWKLARPLGQEQKGVITEKDYRNNLNEKIQILNRRFDISATPGMRMRGSQIG